MSDERFDNEALLWLTLLMGFGFILGILFGGLFLSLPGALLGGALGPMIVSPRSRSGPDGPTRPTPLPRSRVAAMSDERITNLLAPHPPASPPGAKPPSANSLLHVLIGTVLGILLGVVIVASGRHPAALILGPLSGALAGWLTWMFLFWDRPHAIRVRDEALPAGERPRPVPLPRSEAIATAPGIKPRIDRLGGHRVGITGLALSPDGGHLASCDGAGAVVVHDLRTGFQVWAARDFASYAVDLVYSADGRLLVVAGDELFTGGPESRATSVRVYDALNGREFRRLEFLEQVTRLAFVGEGHHLLIGGQGKIRLWDLEVPAEHFVETLQRMTSERHESPDALVFHRGLVLVGCHEGADVRLLTVPSDGQAVLLFLGHQLPFSFRWRSVGALAVSPSGKHVRSAGLDGYARIWALRSCEEVKCFDGHYGWWGWHGVTGVAWLSDDEAVSTGEDGTLRRWDTRTGQELARFDHGRAIRRLAVFGRTAATGASDGSVRLWAL